MIELLLALLILFGWAALGFGAARSLRTGRLEPFSSWLELAGRPPILRTTQPIRFWTTCLSVLWIGWIPVTFLIFVLVDAGWAR
jgi:hypothetical protein